MALIAFSIGAAGPLLIVSAITHIWRRLHGVDNAPGDVAISIFVCLAVYGLVVREDYDLEQAGAYIFVGFPLIAIASFVKFRRQSGTDWNAKPMRDLFRTLSPIRER